MDNQPNILFLMTDQMVGRALEPGHPAKTPNLDRLACRGVRFTQAYTPNPICSPARASLMTGRLPHSHGVLQVTHMTDQDRNVLRTNLPHFAQRLNEAGYHTGYFGKWHVEHNNQPCDFGWKVSDTRVKSDTDAQPQPEVLLEHRLEQPGYESQVLYQVLDGSPAGRGVGTVTANAGGFLEQALDGDRPWCCFASCVEPHDPFVCGQEAFEQYEVDSIPIPENWHDDCEDKPGLYRRSGRVFSHMTGRQKQEAASCYYAMITEVDQHYGKLIDQIERAGQLDNTIIVFTSDHGEMLGAHGLYMKNIGAFEEAYNIPLVMAGPGIQAADPDEHGAVHARVGLHDLCPTLVDLAHAQPIDTGGESNSLAPLLEAPSEHVNDWQQGYAEYYGGRLDLTQRVIWDGPWKLIFNGFDEDELYNLDEDPGEMTNLAQDLAYRKTYEGMYRRMWDRVHRFNDHALGRMHYPVLRLPPIGPNSG